MVKSKKSNPLKTKQFYIELRIDIEELDEALKKVE